MWRLVAESVRGSAHAAAGQRCQDACAAVAVDTLTGPGVLLAAADGAGSAPASELGARTAVDAVIGLGSGQLGPGTLDEGAVSRWFRHAAAAVAGAAARERLQPRDLACTLLVALVLPRRALLAQVGDGAIVMAGEDGLYRTVHWPDNADRPNETTFLTCPDWERALQVTVEERTVVEVALLSDGLQLLALDYARRGAHGPFFRPLFEALRAAPQGGLALPLREFLGSEQVSRRTDDDRTLALATRRFASA